MENEENCISEKCEKLKQLKKLATEHRIERIDEKYLCRYLAGHQNNVSTALKAICNFQSFLNRRRKKWLNLEKSLVKIILESQVLDISDKNGLHDQKIVWIRLEKWDPQIFTADEVLEISGLLCELLYVKTKEIKSIDVIIDMHDFSLKHLYGLSRKFAKRMIFFISQCLPMEILHIFVVRQPKIFYLAYSLYKPFIEDRMKKLINICGYNYEPLIESIGRDVLPLDLDGTSEVAESKRWLNILYLPNTQKDLKTLGYEFYESPKFDDAI